MANISGSLIHVGSTQQIAQQIIQNYGVGIEDLNKLRNDLSKQICSELHIEISQDVKTIVDEIVGNALTAILLHMDEETKNEDKFRRSILQKFEDIKTNEQPFIQKLIAEINKHWSNDKKAIKNLESCSQDMDIKLKEVYDMLQKLIQNMRFNYNSELQMGMSYLCNAKFSWAEQEFNKASQYSQTQADALFGKALAQCKIQLIYDKEKACYQPILHEIYDSLLSKNPAYQESVRLCSIERKTTYERFCNKVESIQTTFKKYEEQGVDYDCFICVKVTDEKGNDTEDKLVADKIYDKFSRPGNKLTIFYSPKSIPVGCDDEVYILYALYKARCMIVVCLNKNYLDTPWVQNEYIRFDSFRRYNNNFPTSLTIAFDCKPIKTLPGIERNFEGIDLRLSEDKEIKEEVFGQIKDFVNAGKIADCDEKLEKARKNLKRAETKLNETEEILANEQKSSTELKKRLELAEGTLEKERTAREEAEARAKAEASRRTLAENERIKAEERESMERKERLTAERKAREADDKIKALERELEELKVQGNEKNVEVIPKLQDKEALAKPKIFYDATEFEIDGYVLKKYKGKKEEVKIPNGVKRIGEYAFEECTELTSIKIPNSVTSIMWRAFHLCSGLTSITIPHSVKDIGDGAFYGCTGLTSIYIPNNVTSIGTNPFIQCDTLESITVDTGNPQYISDENCLIDKKAGELIAGCKSSIIPFGVTSIGSSAFSGCKGLISITIPNSVTSIWVFAFYGCTGLTSITIPNSVTRICSCAFYGCGLQTVYYEGTYEQWRDILIEYHNDCLTKANRYYYSEQQNYDGNHWHWDERTHTPKLWKAPDNRMDTFGIKAHKYSMQNDIEILKNCIEDIKKKTYN